MHRAIRATALATVLAGSACVLGGCAGGSSSRVTGVPVGAETMSRIEPGVTTADRVRAMLGAPTRTNATDDGSQVWVYEWKRVASSGGFVFPIAFGNSRSESVGRAYVEVRDGIVTDAWRD